MVTLQLQSDGGDPLLAEAWVVLEFQGLQGQVSRATHAADELGAGSCIPPQRFSSTGDRTRQRGFQYDLPTGRSIAFTSTTGERRKASSSPGCSS